ncbi:hypothetical protein CSUI_008057, partial [Cystoisospora suis]
SHNSKVVRSSQCPSLPTPSSLTDHLIPPKGRRQILDGSGCAPYSFPSMAPDILVSQLHRLLRRSACYLSNWRSPFLPPERLHCITAVAGFTRRPA